MQPHSKDLRAEVAYLFHRHFQHVSGSLSALRLISVISPLLGLMGTVLRMVKVLKQNLLEPLIKVCVKQ